MAEPPRRGLLIDYGGVLTSSIFASFTTFCRAEGLPDEAVRDQFREAGPGQQLLVDFEEGRIAEPEFERGLAPLLGVEADGLIERLRVAITVDEAMVDAVRAAHAGGVRTGLLSNSWGDAGYEYGLFEDVFDCLVISAREGIRKPAPEIYAIAVERLGLPAEQCVYVDDLGGNLKTPRAMGMATVKHSGAAQTVPELERLLGLDLGART